MKADYLTLSDGRKVRIELNWNAVNAWTLLTGKELVDLANGKAKPTDLLTISYCAAIEGEDIEGRILALTEKEFGRLVNMQGIVDVAKIITEQSATMAQKKSDVPKRSPRIFFRNRG